MEHDYRYWFPSKKKYEKAACHRFDCPLRATAVHALYYYHFSPKYTYHGESHNFYEFFTVVTGRMSVRMGDKSFVLSEKAFILVPPDVFHSMEPYGEYASSISISFSADGLNDELICGKVAELNDSEFDLINVLVTDYINNYENTGYPAFLSPMKNEFAYSQLFKNCLEGLLIFITRDFLQQNDPTQKPFVSPLADETKRYLAEHFREKISLEELAKTLNYSVGHLCHAFKKATGVTVVNYILKLRIDAALIALEQGEQSILAISDSLGFESIQYFTRTFKRETGITPSQYRKNCNSTHLMNILHFRNSPIITSAGEGENKQTDGK